MGAGPEGGGDGDGGEGKLVGLVRRHSTGDLPVYPSVCVA